MADTVVHLGEGEKLVIVDATGKNRITIDPQDNSIVIEGLGDIRLNATGQVSIQGMAGVTIQTDAVMNLHAQAEMTVQSGGELAIQGAMVMINS